jgi:hypothetical protein
MTRPGGFPRINRPPAPAKPAAAAVEAKPAAVAPRAHRTGFSRLPVRATPPAPAAVEYVAQPAPPPLPSAEFFPDADQDVAGPDSARSSEQFPAPLYDDSDDAPEITVPLQPLPRPAPTILHPTRASRLAPPPVRQPGSGLLASIVAPARTRPSFLPPPRERPAPPPFAPPDGGFPLTQATAPPSPSQPRDMPSPAPAPNAEAKHQAAILPPLPERPRVSTKVGPFFDKNGRPLRPKVPLTRHVSPLSPDDIPFD